MATTFIDVFISQNTTGTSVFASGAINQSGMLYSVIVPAASGAPSVQQVIDGQNSSGVAVTASYASSAEASTSGEYVSLSGYGLVSETNYVMYVAASGYVDGLIAAVSGEAFTTPDITAPSWSGVYPTSNSVTGSGVRVYLAINEAGSGFALAVLSGVTPSVSDIKTSGTMVALDANVTGVAVITGLVSETNYGLFAVAEDDSGNTQSSGWFVGYITTSDVTAPSWTSGWPNVSSITVSTASVNLKINDAGSGYFVIIPSGNSTPSAAQIIAHTDSTDTAISAGLYGNDTLVANTEKTLSATNLRYSTYYTVCAVAKDDGGNYTSVGTYSFRTSVPKPGFPGRYSIRRVTRERQRLGNQILNTLRG